MSATNMTLSQRISEKIAKEIVEGKRIEGERLLEKDLAIEYGTSNMPIREAIFLLETQGLVERKPRKGVFVKKYSSKEVFDLYEFCYSITEMALKKGIYENDTEELGSMTQTLNRMKECMANEDLKDTFKEIELFHHQIFRLSNNNILIDVYEKVNMKWTTFRFLTLSYNSSMNESVKEYEAILSGLITDDWGVIKKNLEKKEKRAKGVLREYFILQKSSQKRH